MKPGVDKEHEQHQHKGQPHDQHTKSSGAQFKGGVGVRLLNALRNFANHGVHAGVDHQNLGAASNHRCAHKYGVACIVQLRGGVGREKRILFNRERFSGEQGLVDEKIFRFQDECIGGDQITRS